MKRFLSMVLVLVLVLSTIPISPITIHAADVTSNNFTFTSIDGNSVYIKPYQSKVTVLVFGMCYSTNMKNLLNSIANSDWVDCDDIRTIFVDCSDQYCSSKTDVQNFSNTIDKSDIVYCYDSSGGWETYNAVAYYCGNAGGGAITLSPPMVVLLDESNIIKDVSQNVQSANSIIDKVLEFADIDYTKATSLVNISGQENYNSAYEVLNQLNKLRSDLGLSPLTMDEKLLNGAMQRAAEISIYYSHTRPNGERSFTVLENTSGTLGENIAFGQTTPDSVMNGWTNSTGHYENMTNKDYQSVGIGCFQTSDGYLCWVQMFSSTSSSGIVKTGTQSVIKTIEISKEKILLEADLSKESIVANGKDTSQLDVYLYHSDAQNGEFAKLDPTSFNYSSTNTSVANINDQGIIISQLGGSANVTATLKDDSDISISKKITSSGGITASLKYGADRLSFGQDITGYAGDVIDSLVVYTSANENIASLDISSSNSSVVEIGTIKTGSGDYITSENEHMATIPLKLKAGGTSTITITSPEGVSTNVLVVVYSKAVESEETSQYIQEHISFANSNEYSNLTTNASFYNSIWKHEEGSRNFTRYAAWDVIGRVGKFASLDFYGAFETKNPYDAILVDIFRDYVNNEKSKAAEVFETTTKNILGAPGVFNDVLDVLKTSESWDSKLTQDWLNFTGDVQEDWVQGVFFKDSTFDLDDYSPELYKVLKEFFSKTDKSVFEKAFKNIKNFGTITDYISSGGDVVFRFFDAYQKYLIAEALFETNEYVLASVETIAEFQMTDDNSELLLDALDPYWNACDYDSAFSSVCNIMLEDGLLGSTGNVVYTLLGKELLRDFVFAAIHKVTGLSLGVLVATYNLTYICLDYLSGLGDLTETHRLMNAAALLEKEYIELVKSKAETLVVKKTHQSAAEFDTVWGFLQSLEGYCYKTMSAYVSAFKHEYTTNYVIKTSIANNIFYSAIEKIKLTENLTACDSGIQAVVHLESEWKKNNCHSGEYSDSNLVTVKCPTDVYVYDNKNNLVLSIVNNNVTFSADYIVAFVDGDEKIFVLPTDQKYDVRITATDNGTMDYAVKSFDEIELLRTIRYDDVNLIDGNSYTASVPPELYAEKENYNLKNEAGENIEADFDSFSPKKELTSVEISSTPNKTTYYVGDPLSTAGLNLLLTYSDGSTETVTSGFTTSGFSSTSAGTKNITVSYEGFTDTFTVTVKTPSITLSTSSKSMTVGDSSTITATTTPSGQTITWTSSDTSVATVSGETITAKASGTATITAKFTYNGTTYSKTCSVVVNNRVIVLESMSIVSNPTKTTYYIGDTLNTSGLKLLATYSDGSTETVTSGFTTSGFSSTSTGTKTVTVSYQGYTDTFTVTVETPSITLSSNSKTLVVGDISTITAITTPSGQAVTWTSSNTSVATVSSGTITAKASGSTTITAKFTYNGNTYSKNCSLTIEPNANIITGQCGPNAYYTINLNTESLDITGTGGLYGWSENSGAPWNDYKYSNIKHITIAEGITDIPSCSFYNCTRITDVSIPNTVTNIGYKAFDYCWSLEKIELPESLEEIGQFAFYGCSKLTTIFIPKNVDNIISINAFGGCSSLETIDVDSENAKFVSVDGILYNRSKTKLLRCPSGYGKDISVINGVKSIDKEAFEDCQNIEHITLPDSVTVINDDAFSGCKNLKTIHLSNELEKIYQSAFYYCTSLTDINIPDSTNYIGERAFMGCSNLQRVDLSNITCSSLYEFTFAYCTNLESFVFPNGVSKIYSSAFSSCESLKELVLPDSITTIENSAFKNCISLEKIIIPKSVKYMYSDIFEDCDSLTIYGYKDTEAETYANDESLPFIALDDKELTSISIVSNPSKTLYYTGDSLNVSGLQLKLTYNDGSAETITSGFTTSGFSSTSAGTKIVTVSYERFTDTFTVTVKTPSITLSSSSKVMSVGDSSTITATTTPSGQTVTWTSSNTSVATVSGGTITAKAAGSSTITAKFTYNDTVYSSICTITVADLPLSGSLSINLQNSIIIDSQFKVAVCLNSENTESLEFLLKYDPSKIQYVSHENAQFYNYNTNKELGEIVVEGYTIGGPLKNESELFYITFKAIALGDAEIGITVLNATNTNNNRIKLNGCSSQIEIVHKHYYVFDVTQNPTCTTAGVKTYTCSSCGDSYTESISATGHSWKNATCETPKTCTKCGITDGVVLGHDYASKVTTAATCTTDGVRTYTCSRCAHSYTEKINRTGHSWTAATCTSKKTCSICGVTDGSVLGHNYSSRVTTAATCTTDGVKTYTCSRCSNSYIEKINKTGHSWTAATCTSKKTCSTCGATEGSTLGHSYTSKVTKAATCAANGTKTYICSKCSTSYTEPIAKLAHTEVKVSGKAATCIATGLTDGKKCSVCGMVIVAQNTIVKKAHTYKNITTKATLSKNGKVETKCSVCGYTSNTTTIYYPKTIKLSATSYTYNSKEKTPSVTVKDSKGNTLKKDTDYTVTYASGRKNTGKYSVTVTFKGKYSGKKVLYFNILPSKTSKITPTCGTTSIKASWKKVTGASGYKVELLNSKGKVLKAATTTKLTYTFKKLSKVTTYKVRVTAYKTINSKKVYSTVSTTLTTSTAPAATTLSKVTAGSKQASPVWKTVSGASGYEVQYSTSSKFKSAKTATVKKGSSKKTTIKKLTKGKTYYFKVRAYKTVDGKKVYGAWSSVKSVKVK